MLSALFHASSAQKLIHIKGVQALTAAFSYIPNGFGIEAQYSKFVLDRLFLSALGEYEKGKTGFTSFRYFLASGETGFNLFQAKERFYVNGLAGGRIGNEKIWYSSLEKSGMYASGYAGLECEYYITQNGIAAGLGFKQQLIGKSMVGAVSYGVSLKIRYSF